MKGVKRHLTNFDLYNVNFQCGTNRKGSSFSTRDSTKFAQKLLNLDFLDSKVPKINQKKSEEMANETYISNLVSFEMLSIQTYQLISILFTLTFIHSIVSTVVTEIMENILCQIHTITL